MYITSDISKHADSLGLSKEGEKKLFDSARTLNKFIQTEEKKVAGSYTPEPINEEAETGYEEDEYDYD